MSDIFPVCCDCGWFGMSDDCHYMRCPNCGDRVRKEQSEVTPDSN